MTAFLQTEIANFTKNTFKYIPWEEIRTIKNIDNYGISGSISKKMAKANVLLAFSNDAQTMALLYKGEAIAVGNVKSIKETLKNIFTFARKEKDIATHLDELLQINFLSKIGVNELNYAKFLKGITVSFEFNSTTKGYVSGLLTKNKNEIKSYIFYINDKSGEALKSFLEFRAKSQNITKSANLSTLELGGCSIINPDILKMVKKMGFEKKIIDVPESLGGKTGEKMEIFVKKFNIK